MKTAKFAAALACLLLALPAAAQAKTPRPISFVVIGADGQRIARTVTPAADCPTIRIDGRRQRMALRSAPETLPLRPTQSGPANSKPSVFATRVCETVIPATATSARVGWTRLPLPPPLIRRLVVIGDTGCRIKIASNAYQACNDRKAFPFATVARSIARWNPDLVVHVGDYHYRENACPDDKPGCKGSPWGYGSDTWDADFFIPGRAMLKAAPLAAARGNHESCFRGGQGFMRYLDMAPGAPRQTCDDPANDNEGDYTPPFAVPLGEGAQLLMFDSANTKDFALPADSPAARRYRADFEAMTAQAKKGTYNILVDHHPLLNIGGHQVNGQWVRDGGNLGLQSVFGPMSPTMLPEGVSMVLSGHVHLWEAVGFASNHPAQIVSGFSGTEEDVVPLPDTPPADFQPAPGAVIETLSSWVDGFGFMTLERTGPDAWAAEVRDQHGKVVNRCRIAGRKVACEGRKVTAR